MRCSVGPRRLAVEASLLPRAFSPEGLVGLEKDLPSAFEDHSYGQFIQFPLSLARLSQDRGQSGQVGRLEHKPEGAFQVEIMPNPGDYPRCKQRLAAQVEKIVKQTDFVNTQHSDQILASSASPAERGATYSLARSVVDRIRRGQGLPIHFTVGGQWNFLKKNETVGIIAGGR